jgi:acyl-coenzyme A synthetase/AMP-(fatty) acid ligase/uncharacterized protein YbaR (Trm112 family)
MNKRILNILRCPSCRCEYELISYQENEECIDSAVLLCPTCQLVIPICHGIPLFGESRPKPAGSLQNWLDQLSKRLFGDEKEYLKFLKLKSERKVTDLYAAFQPFNESTRSIYPFLSLLRETLKPGDVILDTWCRTGWSGELLAGLFPEQRIISIWEGDSNVLGYRGFNYWLGAGKRASNLDIVFTHPDFPLPFETNSVTIVHGLDSLHRYQHSSYIPETLRVCKDDGVLIYPHIHLSNSEPVPFFERGCKQYHGRDWKHWLDGLIVNTERCAMVLSEVTLFEMSKPEILQDDSLTEHYNGLILIAPKRFEFTSLTPAIHLPLHANTRFIKNPLLDISVHHGSVKGSHNALSGLGDELLLRHPCYAEKLATMTDEALSMDDARFIWFADNLLALDEIALKMHITFSEAEQIANKLCTREIFHSANITVSMAALQQFYGQSKLPNKTIETFSEIWQSAALSYKNKALIVWLEDESEISFDDADFVVSNIRCRFKELAIGAGDRIAISGAHHPELLLICWAAWLSGITVVVIDKEMPLDAIHALLTKSAAKILFTDQIALNNLANISAIILDGEIANDTDLIYFADWLDALQTAELRDAAIDPESIAVILFTSGSTGQPKGVMLSQKALAVSGQNMAHFHSWENETMLSLGPFSMMSGLRNPAVAALCSGSSILLPGRSTTHHPWKAWEQAYQHQATVITAVPTWLQLILSHPEIEVSNSLKQILLTGAPLNPGLRLLAIQKLNCGIGNYYGLTETGGLCAAQLPEDIVDGETIGIPAGAIMQIIDEMGNPVQNDDCGILQCFSEQLMTGYLDDLLATDKVIRNHWFSTGDIACWDNIGRIKLVGRNDDLIKLRNGALFSPNEIESYISQIDGVQDVAVALKPSTQRIFAYIVSDRLIEQIQADFIAKFSTKLIAYKIPEQWLKVTSLPKNTNGKLKRNELFVHNSDAN